MFGAFAHPLKKVKREDSLNLLEPVISPFLKAKDRRPNYNFFTFGGKYTFDLTTFASEKNSISMPSVNAQLKLWKFYFNAEYTNFSKTINKYQIIPEFNSASFNAGFLFDAKARDESNQIWQTGFTLGYSDNNWVKLLYRTAKEYVITNLTATDISGKQYFLQNFYVTTHVPYYSFSYIMNIIQRKKLRDPYHDFSVEKKTFSSGSLTQMGIDIMYAPTVNYDNAITYSPYGYYVPRALYISDNFYKKQLGAKINFSHTFPFGLGFKAEMGTMPGIVDKNTKLETKMNFYLRVGFSLNLIVIR
jgi:hypothetical protein